MPRRRRHRKHNPVAEVAETAMEPFANPYSGGEKTILTLLALGAVGYGIYWWMNRYTLTLAPGSQSLKVPPGTAFTLKLPSGASWTSIAAGSPTAMPTAALASGNAPMQMPTSSAGEMVVAIWKDSGGAAQTSTVTLTS